LLSLEVSKPTFRKMFLQSIFKQYFYKKIIELLTQL
jgi:hypothetical protein